MFNIPTYLFDFRTIDRGWGVRSPKDIEKGDLIIEYVGEVIDSAELKTRMKQKFEAKDTNYYFLRLNNSKVIDAGPMGNLARYKLI